MKFFKAAISSIAIAMVMAAIAQPGHLVAAGAPDDRAILHVLNRVAFGPRPGDVGRVRAIGISAFIDQQLHPDRVPDPSMAPRLADLATVEMSSRALADEYERPAIEARRAKQNQGDDAERPRMPDPAQQ